MQQKWVESDVRWHRQFEWVDEACSLATKLWADGESATAVAAALMQKFPGWLSRSAVIGKLHRMGASGSAPPWKKRSTQNGPRKRAPRPRAPKPFLSAAEQARRAALGTLEDRQVAQATPDIVIPEKDRISIADLPDGACKWPFGDGPMYFGCPHGCVTGLPYCDFHARRAFVPPPPRGAVREALTRIDKMFATAERA